MFQRGDTNDDGCLNLHEFARLAALDEQIAQLKRELNVSLTAELATAPAAIEISVALITGQSHTLRVHGYDTVAELKAQLHDTLGFQPAARVRQFTSVLPFYLAQIVVASYFSSIFSFSRYPYLLD